MATRTSSRRLLESALWSFARAPSGPGASDIQATVALDVGDGEGWTLRLEQGRLFLASGLVPKPDTLVKTDPDTLLALLQGEESGVKAFLDGRVRVRGNLALSLRLDGVFDRPDRPARFPRSRTVTAGRLRTFYLEAGEGPPVILLHGLGATNASLLPTLWDLGRDHRVLVPDLPGFGESAKPVRAYRAAFFARWLRAFMDEVGVDRTDLVGNSLGGRVALEMGLEEPGRLRKLVLLTPSPAFIRRREFARIVRLLRPELAVLPVPLVHRYVVRGIKFMFSRPERLPDEWYAAAADEFIRIFRTRRGRIAFFSAARQIYLEEPYGDHGFWDRLPELRTPALFVWGERDRLVPARFERHVQRAVPKATSVVLRDCGHVPQYELPEETHRIIRDFLA
jgi:pimeloyl-ACP methyl ester carboxylesterase